METFAFAASPTTPGGESDLHARFSVPRCVATVVVDGRLDAGGFLPDGFDRPDVVGLIDRIRLAEVPEFSAALPAECPARVTVRTATTTGVGEVRNARGNPDSALADAEVVEKFTANVGPYLARDVLDPVIGALTGAAGATGGSSLQRLARSLAARSAGA